ncbi:MAG: ATP-binding protein, partial [Bacillota bacterium]|nr:ATP-binding protein [Bacillota bacterium]
SSAILPDTKKNEKRILLIIEDITNDKLREEQLLHSNKIAALGQLAAGITHEIRNPIGLIRNYIYIIKNKLYVNKKELNENIKGIDNALDSVNEFINNLLNFSRISYGEKEVIYLKDFFNEIKKLTIRNLEKNNISLFFKGNECEIYFNKESLKHILFNLISNASDSIVSDGEIIISFEKIDENIIIIVKDNGKGIKKENLNKVFDPFFTTKYPDKGTGLGLNIVFKEIKKNGGNIRVESEYLKGASFIITLPLRGEKLE